MQAFLDQNKKNFSSSIKIRMNVSLTDEHIEVDEELQQMLVKYSELHGIAFEKATKGNVTMEDLADIFDED